MASKILLVYSFGSISASYFSIGVSTHAENIKSHRPAPKTYKEHFLEMLSAWLQLLLKGNIPPVHIFMLYNFPWQNMYKKHV